MWSPTFSISLRLEMLSFGRSNRAGNFYGFTSLFPLPIVCRREWRSKILSTNLKPLMRDGFPFYRSGKLWRFQNKSSSFLRADFFEIMRILAFERESYFFQDPVGLAAVRSSGSHAWKTPLMDDLCRENSQADFSPIGSQHVFMRETWRDFMCRMRNDWIIANKNDW